MNFPHRIQQSTRTSRTRRTEPNPRNIAGWVAAAATGVAATAAWAAHRETRKYQLHHVTLPILKPGSLPKDWDSFRLLHISDLHMLDSQQEKQHWVAQLNELDPDLVVNTGDNLGERQGVPGVLRALDPLLNRPGVFVFGSNDYYAPRPVNPFIYLLGKKRKPSQETLPWEGMRAAFIERGWRDATHRRIEFSIDPVSSGSPNGSPKVKIAIAGVDDPHHELDNYAHIAGAAHPEADISIGLTHSPEPHILDSFAADNYQLVLAGHTHGGQLCLPGGRAIVTNCGIDRSRARGLSRWSERTWLHVTNGLGNSKFVPFRVFCRPSATLIHLTEAAV